MPALPARNIRNIKTDQQTNRPRDQALFNAANDNPTYAKSVTKNFTKKAVAANDNFNPAYPSVDQEFSASYAKAGLQPTFNLTDQTRNVRKDAKFNEFEDGVGTNSNYQGRYSEKPRQVSTEYRQLPVTQSGEVTRGLKIANVVVKKADDRIQRLKITRINGMLFWPLVGFWGTFQLPLAVVSLITFAFAGFIESVTTPQAGGGFVSNLIRNGVDTLLDAAALILKINFGPADIYYLTAAAVFFIGAGLMILISIIYTLSSVRFFSGQAAALKISTYVLAFFCYLIPFFNIFPWHLLWMAVVWRYPK